MRYLSKSGKDNEPVRYDYGTASQSGNFTTTVEMTHLDGNPRRHIITPTFNCWVQVGFHGIVVNVGTDWGRMDAVLNVSPQPPTLPGQVVNTTWARDIKYAHPVTSWVGTEVRTWVPLTANVTYTMTASFVPQGQTWNYYRGEYSWFERGPLMPRLTT